MGVYPAPSAPVPESPEKAARMPWRVALPSDPAVLKEFTYG